MIAPPRTLEEEFLELVLADDRLVRAEFDEIVAAAGLEVTAPPHCQPPYRPGTPPTQPHSTPSQDGDVERRLTTPRRVRVTARSVGRERSPP